MDNRLMETPATPTRDRKTVESLLFVLRSFEILKQQSSDRSSASSCIFFEAFVGLLDHSLSSDVAS